MKSSFSALATFLVSIALSSHLYANPKLYIFECGMLYLDDVAMFNLSDDETQVRELFVPCYVIKHEQGYLFWDGGLPKIYADKSGLTKIEGGYALYERWIVDQLKDINLKPEDFKFAAYSHLHFDHAGAANYFTDATVLMQQTEWDGAFGSGQGFIDTSLFDDLENAKVQYLKGDHDVFGDGTVRLIYTPGHTSGHQALFVDLANYGPVVLSGDLFHFRENRSLRRPPDFNINAEQTLESMDKIEELLTNTNATLWIEHDKARADTLKKSPEFFD